MPYEPIYRDYHCSLSNANCSNLLRAIAISGGSIVGTFTTSNAFPKASVGRWTMFFKLKFRTETEMQSFHALGFETKEPPLITGQELEAKPP